MALFQELGDDRHHRRARHARARHRRVRRARGRRCATGASAPTTPADAAARAGDLGAAPRRRGAAGGGRHEPARRRFRVALRALLRNKMRSFLTTLGIIIGVGAVIAMVAIGEGAKAQVEQAFAAMGTNLLIVMPGSDARRAARAAASARMPTLTWDDLRAIQREVPAVRYAAPQLRTERAGRERGSELDHAASPARRPSTSRSATGRSARARLLADVGRRRRRPRSSCSARPSSTSSSAPSADPIGQIGAHQEHPVPGRSACWRRKGQSPIGQDYDDVRLRPVSRRSMTKIQGGLQKFIAGHDHGRARRRPTRPRAPSADHRRCCAIATTSRHGADDDFSIRNLTEMASAQQEGTQTLTTLLASIAAVSLLVGGIGIMNIMLVSVTERTREIGAAHGGRRAPRRHPAQFLVEALTLSVAGGVVGVATGAGHRASGWRRSFGWPMLVRPEIVVIAVGVQRRWSASSSASTRRARRRASIRSRRCGTSERAPSVRSALGLLAVVAGGARRAAAATAERLPAVLSLDDALAHRRASTSRSCAQARANTVAAEARVDEARAPLLPQVNAQPRTTRADRRTTLRRRAATARSG